MKRSEFLELMKNRLEAQRAALLASASAELHELQNVSEDGTNSWEDERDDVGTITDNMNALLLEHAGEELQQVNRALEGFRQGEYGNCEECGCRIPMERLRAKPFATHCVRCQEGLELAEASRSFARAGRTWPDMPWRRNDTSAFRSRHVQQIW